MIVVRKAKKVFTVFLLVAVITGCSQDPAQPLYENAEGLFSQMTYEKAIEAYSNIVNKYPESPYAPASQYKIGLIYNLFLKNMRRAMYAYSTLMLLYPNSKEVLLARQDMADIYARKGDYGKAIGEYQWLMKKSRGVQRDNFQYKIAMTYLKLTDVNQTRIELQEIVKNSPNSTLAPEIYYQIANTYYLEGNCYEAINGYDKVITLYPVNSYADEARLKKAVCIEETGNLAEAMRLYKDLENSYPNPEIIKLRIDAIETRENKPSPVALKREY
jgi:TolA-binding protein